MTTTMNEALTYTVGQRFHSRESLHGLPVGAQVTSSRTDNVYTHEGEGAFRRNHDGYYPQSLTLDLLTLTSLPESNEPRPLQVGDHVRIINNGSEHGLTHYHPIGTVVEVTGVDFDNNPPYVRTRGVTAHSDTMRITENSRQSTPIASVELVVEFTVGQVISEREQFSQVPVGTVIRHTAGSMYTRTATGYLSEATATNLTVDNFIITGNYVIVSLPGSVTEPAVAERAPLGDVSEQVSLRFETLMQYQQRLRTIALGAAYANSVRVSAVREALETLNVDPEVIGTGSLLHLSDEEGFAELPHGTLLRFPSGRVMGRESGGYWNTLVTTSVNVGQYDVGVVERPDQPAPVEWSTREGSMFDMRAIQAFRREVYDVGMAAKSDQKWCGVAEAVLAAVGITASGDEVVADLLSAAQVSDLPEGTIIKVAGVNGFAYLIRDDRAENPARTTRLWGSLSGHWSSNANSVMGESIPATSLELAHAPVGVTISTDTVELWGFIKTGPNQWHYQRIDQAMDAGATGSYTDSSFSTSYIFRTINPS